MIVLFGVLGVVIQPLAVLIPAVIPDDLLPLGLCREIDEPGGGGGPRGGAGGLHQGVVGVYQGLVALEEHLRLGRFFFSATQVLLSTMK